MSRTVELTDAEILTIRSALEKYRRIKGAERMLESQKIRDEAQRKASYDRYDVLLGYVDSAAEKVS